GDEALVARTKEFLAREDVNARPAMKRIVVENLANVERALKAQKADR
ncbi:MAG: hypothetical protein RL142_881, partial [Actinomycetota bacterium]